MRNFKVEGIVLLWQETSRNKWPVGRVIAFRKAMMVLFGVLIYIYIFSIVTLYTKNIKQIKNTINSAPITIYVVEGKLNVKKRRKKKSELN